MKNLHEKLKDKFGAAVLETHAYRGDETAVIAREKFSEAARFVKENADFDMDMLVDLAGVDGLNLKWSPRFEVVYHFLSMKQNHRLRLKVGVPESDAVMPTVSALWQTANWLEREVWDMFGIKFEGHPDLRRILMYEEFKGHPLRKDYPFNKRQPLIGPKS